MKIKSILFFIFIISKAFVQSANAQFKAERFFSPILELGSQYNFKTKFIGNGEDISQRSYSIRYTRPLLTKVSKGKESGTFSVYSLQTIIQGQWIQPRSEIFPLTYDLYDTRVGLRAILFPGGKHLFFATGTVIFKGDQKTFLRFRNIFNASLLYHYRINQNTGVHIGAAFTDQLDKTRMVPLLGLFYKNYPLNISLFLPVSARIQYAINSKIKPFVMANVNGYNMQVQDMAYMRRDIDRFADIRNRSINIAAGFNLRFHKGLRIEIAGGILRNATYNFVPDIYDSKPDAKKLNGGFASLKLFFSDGYENKTSHAFNYLEKTGLNNSTFFYD